MVEVGRRVCGNWKPTMELESRNLDEEFNVEGGVEGNGEGSTNETSPFWPVQLDPLILFTEVLIKLLSVIHQLF